MSPIGHLWPGDTTWPQRKARPVINHNNKQSRQITLKKSRKLSVSERDSRRGGGATKKVKCWSDSDTSFPQFDRSIIESQIWSPSIHRPLFFAGHDQNQHLNCLWPDRSTNKTHQLIAEAIQSNQTSITVVVVIEPLPLPLTRLVRSFTDQNKN